MGPCRASGRMAVIGPWRPDRSGWRRGVRSGRGATPPTIPGRRPCRSRPTPLTATTIPEQRHRATDRADYDAALRQRGGLTVRFTDEAVAAWRAAPPTTRGGQPRCSPLAILTALTLRAVFRLALRQTEGLTGSTLRLLGLDLAVPDHTTSSWRSETLEVPPRPRSGSEPVRPPVDGTGLKLGGPGEWLVEEHGTEQRRSWRKLHPGVDADTGRIAAVELTGDETGDGCQVGLSLDQVTGPIASFTGDGAYDREDVHEAVAHRHPEAAVIVPPRRGAVPSTTAETDPTRRDRHLRSIAEHGRRADGRPPATIVAPWPRRRSRATNG